MSEQNINKIKVAITAISEEVCSIIELVARSCGFNNLEIFTNPRTTIEVAKRQQFNLFITNHNFADMTGLTMVQTLRSTGNYGIEAHLFLVESISSEILLELVDNNISHVLTKPFSHKRIGMKLAHLWNEEKNISAFETKFREAHAAFNSGQIEMSTEYGLDLLKEFGLNDKTLLLLGDSYGKANKLKEARHFFEIALTKNPNSASASHKLARTYMLEGNFEKSAEMMNRLQVLNPLNIEILANAGLSNFEIGNYEKAKFSMVQLHKLDKKRQDASEVLAKVAIKERNYEAALEHLKDNHDKKEIIQILNNEGAKIAKSGDALTAIDLYLKGLSVVTDCEFVYALHYNLGLVYVKINELDNAKKYFRKSLEIRPDFAKANIALGRLEAKSA